MRVIDPLRLYPGRWRARYGDEMAALLADRRPSRRDRMDLLRGALDAWLHPPTPSVVPPLAAVAGGGLWTILATILVLQPVPPDWPGYVIEVVPLAALAVVGLYVAVVGCVLRLGDTGGRAAAVAVVIATAGYALWALLLLGTLGGLVSAAALAAAQTFAMIGTALIGILLVRVGDEPIGALVAAAPVLMVVPTTIGWLAFGTIWTVVGLLEFVERSTRIGPAGIAR